EPTTLPSPQRCSATHFPSPLIRNKIQYGHSGIAIRQLGVACHAYSQAKVISHRPTPNPFCAQPIELPLALAPNRFTLQLRFSSKGFTLSQVWPARAVQEKRCTLRSNGLFGKRRLIAQLRYFPRMETSFRLMSARKEVSWTLSSRSNETPSRLT